MTSQTAKMIVRNIGNTLTSFAEKHAALDKTEGSRYDESIHASFKLLLDDRQYDIWDIKRRLHFCVYLATAIEGVMYLYAWQFFSDEERKEVTRACNLLSAVRVDDNGVFSLDY